MVNHKYKHFFENENSEEQLFCEAKIKTFELMALRTKKLCLSSIKLFCWGCDNTRPSWLSQMTPPPARIRGDLGITTGVNCQRLLAIDLIGTPHDFQNVWFCKPTVFAKPKRNNFHARRLQRENLAKRKYLSELSSTDILCNHQST